MRDHGVLKRILLPYRESETIGAYEAAVWEAGMEPVSVETRGSLSVEGFTGLLLTGGSDVNPKLYGEAPHPETEPPDDERDAIELTLIGEALQRDLPLFAICRGLQILNVYHGGTLVQHLATVGRHEQRPEQRSEPAHRVQIAPDTLLASITGEFEMPVNSRHHQGAARVGEGLRVSARDTEDGTVEALERDDKRFVLAVQWHPENQVFTDPLQLKLFRAFADAL